MIKNKKAENLVGIIIAVFILSFTLLSIINIIGFSQGLEEDYTNTVFFNIIKSNAENIVKKIEIEKLNDNEIFYIKKDTNNLTFKILTGSTNEKYKYIDFLGNNVDPNTNEGKVLIRTYKYKKDILKYKVKPNEIKNLIFWYDSTNIDGNNNDSLNDGDKINELTDLSGNGNIAYQNTDNSKPIYKEKIIKGNDAISFSGSNRLYIDDNILINTDNDSSTSVEFKEKSFSFVIKTSNDVSSDQIIYEQGGTKRGYSFMIHEKDLYLGVWNTEEWDSGDEYKSLNLGELLPNTIYFITLIQNSKTLDDSLNKIELYKNGLFISDLDHIDLQTEQENNIGIGALVDGTVLPWEPYNNDSGDDKYHFKGYLCELIGWNHSLTKTEIKGIQKYFEHKWYNKKDEVKYNLIETNISVYK